MNWESEAASRLPHLLRTMLRAPVDILRRDTDGFEVDLAFSVGDWVLLFEIKGSDDIATLTRAAAQITPASRGQELGVIAVPYMGPKARAWAEANGVSWVDLSGNADIRGDGLCIVVAGNKNRYASRGRPSNPFTPRYSRVSRALLAHADRWWKQVELADEVGLPSGTVSKVIQRLDALELIERNEARELRARAPSVLLDSWAQRYRFADQAVRGYHLTARSGEEALRDLAERMTDARMRFAATGLSAAWLYTAFAGFRLNTFIVERHPVEPEALGLRPVECGANVWLVVPRDDGAFYAKVEQVTWCAHPVQVYLDLAAHPERAPEAASELRAQCLSWRA
ncbi:MAG: hypothetical protein GXP62_20640 [Oligoflexia bacterium]|nr:hypothetical protein [Oligoflexia bacterium]